LPCLPHDFLDRQTLSEQPHDRVHERYLKRKQ
jgi:hypothetical protein